MRLNNDNYNECWEEARLHCDLPHYDLYIHRKFVADCWYAGISKIVHSYGRFNHIGPTAIARDAYQVMRRTNILCGWGGVGAGVAVYPTG